MKIIEISKSKNKHKNKQLIFYHTEMEENDETLSQDPERPIVQEDFNRHKIAKLLE